MGNLFHRSQVAGSTLYMALTSDGKLYGWGWNKIGVGDNQDHCFPMEVRFPDEQRVVQISSVTERHNVFSWGRGTNGQLGHMTGTNDC
nr:ultraviolet-B receptor UVR8 [Tanacetum cinerariifolium]